VPRDLLQAHGAVHPDVARAMAVGVARLLGADHGVGTTGVAGPDPQDGRPPGTFHVAVAGPAGTVVRSYDVGPLGRAAVRAAARDAALRLLLDQVLDDAGGGPGTSDELSALDRA